MTALADLPSLKNTLAKHGIAARKSLGQHFLLDESITDRIAALAGDVSQCQVIEIGPGPGGLTRSLLKRGATVTAIEKDSACMGALKELAAAAEGKLTLLEADALETDMMGIVPSPRKVVANLPYNVGTVLLFQWLEMIYTHGHGAFESLTLMFQKEVADRITAKPDTSEYGKLSVMTQWLCTAQHAFDLPPGAFSPPPKVASSVIQLIPRTKPLYPVAQKDLSRLLAAAFGQRRKMLRSALKPLGGDAASLCERAGINPAARAETLTVLELCRLAEIYA